MKRVILLIGVLFLMSGVIAPHDIDDSEEVSGDVDSITLKYVDGKLKWEVEGYSDMGFKIVWSKSEGPTYPLRGGDKYHYYSEPERNYDTLEAFDGEGKYYVRVC